MSTIIVQPGRPGHPEPHPDTAARQRQDRLARATAEDMETALAFLSMIDPAAFEIVFTAAAARAEVTGEIPDSSNSEDDEPIPVCRECGALVGIFLADGLRWQHFRGDRGTSGRQEIYDPGHPAKVYWALLGEDPEEL